MWNFPPSKTWLEMFLQFVIYLCTKQNSLITREPRLFRPSHGSPLESSLHMSFNPLCLLFSIRKFPENSEIKPENVNLDWKRWSVNSEFSLRASLLSIMSSQSIGLTSPSCVWPLELKKAFRKWGQKKYFLKQNTIFGNLVKIKEASFCRSGKRKKSSQLIWSFRGSSCFWPIVDA